MFKIGVLVDNYNVSVWDGIKKASRLGIDGIQIYTVSGETDPDAMGKSDRKKLLDYVKGFDLVFSALCGDLGGSRFEHAADNAWRVAKTKRIMELAIDLRTEIVTTHLGELPDDQNADEYEAIFDSYVEIAEYGSKLGVKFATETGADNTALLKSFLDSIDSDGVGVNYDPANLIMSGKDDPVAGVGILGKYIVHTHAKDGNTRPPNVRTSYETPLGEGELDFRAYFDALKSIDYDGYLTVEREAGDNPEADIKTAVEYLKGLI